MVIAQPVTSLERHFGLTKTYLTCATNHTTVNWTNEMTESRAAAAAIHIYPRAAAAAIHIDPRTAAAAIHIDPRAAAATADAAVAAAIHVYSRVAAAATAIHVYSRVAAAATAGNTNTTTTVLIIHRGLHRISSWILKRFGEYRRKLWNDMEIME